MNRRIRTVLGVALAATLVTTAAPAPAAAHDRRPSVIALPDGFQPEGVAAAGRYAWFGSRATGEIYRADLITGAGKQVSPATGTPSLGLKVDARGRLFVAGGTAGDARVVDTRTGAVLASYRFAEAPTFVNDVTLTRDAAWFTDSNRPVLYRLPLGHGGTLPPAGGFTTLPLTGDFQQIAAPASTSTASRPRPTGAR
ncbi:hypothetical protein [Micromonospora chalcea]|uniref:hypothetical protein n=1 Tax=Micromonospora chalcea TaxID=1874 RepID=UPI001FC9A3DA|nr:hypothetical protein [Micromonospora chalcea]